MYIQYSLSSFRILYLPPDKNPPWNEYRIQEKNKQKAHTPLRIKHDTKKNISHKSTRKLMLHLERSYLLAPTKWPSPHPENKKKKDNFSESSGESPTPGQEVRGYGHGTTPRKVTQH